LVGAMCLSSLTKPDGRRLREEVTDDYLTILYSRGPENPEKKLRHVLKEQSRMSIVSSETPAVERKEGSDQ